MKCPYCECMESNVVETRKNSEGEIVRRRRECKECGKRFTTYETVSTPKFDVVKSDGSVEEFDREKLRSGIERACEKRPVEESQIEEVVSSVEDGLVEEGLDSVDSERVGEMVMERLKEIDEVAYIRFASVYRSFDDAGSFKEELEQLEDTE